MDFKTVIEEILRDVTPLKRKGTQDLYFIYLSEIRLELGDQKLSEFTRARYMAWIWGFKTRKARRTFFDYTKFINLIFNFAYQQKYVSHLIKFPSIDTEREEIGRVYTTNELYKLWQLSSETMRVQLVLSLECFMRLREVLHLTWDRVNLDRRVIMLRRQDVKTGSKTGVGRVIPLTANAVYALKDRHQQADTMWVFPNPAKTNCVNDNKTAWALLKSKSGIKGRARWHDLRHTALSYAVLEKRLPLAHISKAAGLSIRTLERVYLHHDVEHLRDVAENMNIF
jgi:integrase